MHLDAAFTFDIAGIMGKRLQVKRSIEFSVDARQKVQVECSGNALLIIIGCMQNVGVLLKINTDYEATAGPKHAGRHRQELLRVITGKITNC